MQLDVREQPAVRQQAQRVQSHPERAAGGLLESTGVPGGQHVDLLRSQLDGVGDRRVVGHASVHQLPVPPLHGRQHARDRRARHDGLHKWALGEQQLLAGHDVDRHHVQGNRQLLEVVVLNVLGHEPAEAGVGDEMGARTEEAQQAGQGVERKNLSAVQSSPDGAELIGRIGHRWALCDEGPIDRAGGGRHDQVGLDPMLVQRAQHADLDGSEAGATGEDKGSEWAGRSHVRWASPGREVLRKTGARRRHQLATTSSDGSTHDD